MALDGIRKDEPEILRLISKCEISKLLELDHHLKKKLDDPSPETQKKIQILYHALKLREPLLNNKYIEPTIKLIFDLLLTQTITYTLDNDSDLASNIIFTLAIIQHNINYQMGPLTNPPRNINDYFKQKQKAYTEIHSELLTLEQKFPVQAITKPEENVLEQLVPSDQLNASFILLPDSEKPTPEQTQKIPPPPPLPPREMPIKKKTNAPVKPPQPIINQFNITDIKGKLKPIQKEVISQLKESILSLSKQVKIRFSPENPIEDLTYEQLVKLKADLGSSKKLGRFELLSEMAALGQLRIASQRKLNNHVPARTETEKTKIQEDLAKHFFQLRYELNLEKATRTPLTDKNVPKPPPDEGIEIEPSPEREENIPPRRTKLKNQ